MKKFMMTLAAVLCCAMTTTVFTSCGDDEEGDINPNSPFVGVWQQAFPLSEDQLVLTPKGKVFLPDGRILTVSTASAGTPISKNPNIATFDMAGVGQGTLTVRPWKDGDRFVPFGMKGSKLVSDFLTDIKVSPSNRKNQLVVSFNKEIIWILGRRTCNRHRVTDQTEIQLILTLSDC